MPSVFSQISHKGSPFRIAILDETETARAVLLDHIPHNDDSAPDSNNESTYTPYKMSVFVPDVLCSKCSLQLLYLMTDKTTNCGIDTCFYNPADAACKGSTNEKKVKCLGAPNSNVCVEENECFSNCEYKYLEHNFLIVFIFTSASLQITPAQMSSSLAHSQ